jgi:hypothetical protein
MKNLIGLTKPSEFKDNSRQFIASEEFTRGLGAEVDEATKPHFDYLARLEGESLSSGNLRGTLYKG